MEMTENPNRPLPAALPDDAELSAEIAALYLRVAPAELAESQKSRRTDGRVEKNTKPHAAPTRYLLGGLRALERKQPSSAGLEAALKSGLPGWTMVKIPFFAELEPRVKRGRRVLIGCAWGVSDPSREARFAELVDGRIRFTWITAAEAVASLWADAADHRAFAAIGLALLKTEMAQIEAAITASERLAAN
ncbi:hypothetical protein GN316_03395 [Xylophilus sp. Kf1]|nr:hypothetical protein [Xylophilus sp. Kf1]